MLEEDKQKQNNFKKIILSYILKNMSKKFLILLMMILKNLNFTLLSIL